MKKVVVFIVLILTMATAFIPCCCVDECCSEQTANTTSHDKHQNEGSCSPFFVCATCPGSVELTKQFQLGDPIVEKAVHHQTLMKVDLPTYSRSFWQPPRFC